MKHKLPIVRLIPNDDPTAKEWLEGNRERNNFEERLLKYPRLRMWQAENGKKLAVLTSHPVMMLDSSATRPDAEPVEAGRAVFEALKVICSDALGSGVQEVMFMATDEITAKAAESVGFVESKAKWYRLNLPLAEEIE